MIQNIQQWAEFTFHGCNLGDKRDTDQLIKMVCGLAKI
jgi:hypothetical protein